MRQGIRQTTDIDDVLLGGISNLTGLQVLRQHSGSKGGETDLLAAHHEIVLGIPAGKQHMTRTQGDRLVHHVIGESDDPGLLVGPATSFLQDVQGLVTIDTDARGSQNVQRGGVQLIQGIPGERLQPPPGRHFGRCYRTVSHSHPPF
jgi:hypothetical protein